MSLAGQTPSRAWPALLLVLAAAGCAARRAPVVVPLRSLEPKTPLVLIPGITGTKLRDVRSGRLVWGNARRLFLPRDGGYSAARPLGPGVEDTIEPDLPVTRIRPLGLFEVDIYGSLIRGLEEHGYESGDLRAPRPGDELFVFAYDWRASHVDAARELVRQLRALRRARGDAVLHVDLICHSNASTIARYMIKYGDASIDEAASGERGPPVDLHVDRLILVGTANGGALGTMLDLNHGRTYVPLVGRRMRPETLFTFPSLFEALPAPDDDLFFDETGRPLAVDLYDPESWRRYGWSVWAPKTRRRLERADRADLFTDAATRRAYLERALDRGVRLHALLARDVPGFPRSRYYSVQNGYERTPVRALLLQHDEGWRTLLGKARRVRRDPRLSAQADAPGDGHASIASQNALSPQERAALAAPTTWVAAGHRTIVGHPAALERILEILAEPYDGAALDARRRAVP